MFIHNTPVHYLISFPRPHHSVCEAAGYTKETKPLENVSVQASNNRTKLVLVFGYSFMSHLSSRLVSIRLVVSKSHRCQSLTRNYESQTSWANIVFFCEFNLTWTRRGNLFIQMAFNDSLCIILLLLIRVSRGDSLLFLLIESSYLYVKICMNFNLSCGVCNRMIPMSFHANLSIFINRHRQLIDIYWSHCGTHCANIAKLPIARLFDKSLCIWFDVKELHTYVLYREYNLWERVRIDV